MDGLLGVSIYIDAVKPKKLQYFPNIYQNSQETAFQNEKSRSSCLIVFYSAL